MGNTLGDTHLPPDQQDRLRPRVEDTPLPTVEVLGTTHIISYVNPAFCALLGKTRGDLLGSSFATIVPRGDECAAILDRVYRSDEGSEEPAAAEENASGSNPADFLYAMWPALNANELPVGVIIQLPKATNFRQEAAAINEALLISGLHQHELAAMAEVEITERKLVEAGLLKEKDRLANQAEELERLVAERTAKLQETVGELEAFSYSLAHDMRAPLRSMRGFSQILLAEYSAVLDAKAIDYLERIARSSTRLDRLIQNVLDYTKIVRGQVEEASVDLNCLLRDMLETYLDWQPPKANIVIDGILPKVLGNEAYLTQCVSNLLGNAVKFVSPGTVPRITISAEPDGARVRLCIRDNGIGIAADKHARIFGMFEKIHPPTEYEGTGIGLTIARKAAHRMGGEIGFHSELGKGSTFWVELKKG